MEVIKLSFLFHNIYNKNYIMKTNKEKSDYFRECRKNNPEKVKS